MLWIQLVARMAGTAQEGSEAVGNAAIRDTEQTVLDLIGIYCLLAIDRCLLVRMQSRQQVDTEIGKKHRSKTANR